MGFECSSGYFNGEERYLTAAAIEPQGSGEPLHPAMFTH
jgi:hypothetical protein